MASRAPNLAVTFSVPLVMGTPCRPTPPQPWARRPPEPVIRGRLVCIRVADHSSILWRFWVDLCGVPRDCPRPSSDPYSVDWGLARCELPSSRRAKGRRRGLSPPRWWRLIRPIQGRFSDKSPRRVQHRLSG